MKTAYQYIRISNEDQSNFSISGQQLANQEYAKRNNIIILKTFIDDGYSAKDFNRPNWRLLEQELTKNKVDFLIVTKYDRLIRNILDGLFFINKLEETLKIKLISVMEDYGIDPQDPYSFTIRIDMFKNAEYERRRISDRSRMGMWSGKSQGRYLGLAPFGYKNARDENDKPIIVIDPEQKAVVEQIFKDYLSGLPFTEVLKKARENGFKQGAKEAIKRVLSNYTYAGLLKVRAYRSDPEKIVKGIHERIIDENTFLRVQAKLKENTRVLTPKIYSSDLPLRGYLLCECGKLHTGTRCKGRSKYYFYYWCENHKDKVINAGKVDNDIKIILKGLSLEDKYIRALERKVIYQTEKSTSNRRDQIIRLNREQSEAKKKLTQVADKYFSSKINDQEYQHWKSTYTQELSTIQNQLSRVQDDTRQLKRLYDEALPHFGNLVWIYEIGTPIQKQAVLKAIMPMGLITVENGYQTAFIQSPFSYNAIQISFILEVKNKMGAEFIPNPHRGWTKGVKSNHIEDFLRLIQQILKKAA